MKLKDAKKDLFVHICAKDCDGAVRNDGQRCIAARAMKRMHHFADVRVMRNTVHTLNRGSKTWVRRMIDRAGLALIRSFDKTGKLPEDGISLRLKAPVASKSLEYFRSPEFRQWRQASAERSKGKKARPYNRNNLPGVRWGKKAA